jgi:hydrogenase/urease accessory protein HupE
MSRATHPTTRAQERRNDAHPRSRCRAPAPPKSLAPLVQGGARSSLRLAAALCASIGLALVAPRAAHAHEFRPGLLEITAAGGGRYEIAWTPAPEAHRAQPVFPAECARAAEPASERRFFLDCGPAGLAGRTITVTGLAPLRDEVLVRIHLENDQQLTAMLGAARPSIVVPAAPSGRSIATTIASYAAAGAGHLITGLDHVLFVLGLLLLVRGAGPLLRAITAFTLAHSLTLALQVLGAVRLPPPPVEAAIALSVLFLARELVRPPASPTLMRRRPWLAAFGFGLLHGLGFAGGLASLHLPEGQIAPALLGFNLGLEAAQLALVLAALGAARALRGRAPAWPAWTARIPAYGIGTAAAFWLLQRVLAG